MTKQLACLLLLWPLLSPIGTTWANVQAERFQALRADTTTTPIIPPVGLQRIPLTHPIDGNNQVRFAPPSITLPSASLYLQHPEAGSRFLIEADPRYASYRQWLGSDYMLSALGSDPSTIQKRLGDGFYEQKLIREQVARLTGNRYLADYTNDEQQYQALMDSGITFAQQWHLRPGIALSPEQVASLTADIVWLVSQTVTLPDGTKQDVLVPQVYVRPQVGDLLPGGALLAGSQIKINTTGDLTNAGTLAGRQIVALSANNVSNLNGRITGNTVSVKARQDLNNIGGTIQAADQLALEAGRDINIASTLGSNANAQSSTTFIDRVAGLYVTGTEGQAGTLVASAGRDLSVLAGIIQNQGTGSTELAAGQDIRLGTFRTGQSQHIVWDSANQRSDSQSREIGSQITTQGDLSISAGRKLSARAAQVNSGGELSATAQAIMLEAGRQTQSVDEAHQHKGTSSGVSTKTITTRDAFNDDRALGSSFEGKTVTLKATDLAIQGSQVIADQNLNLNAQNDIRIEAAQNQHSETHFQQTTQSGLMGAGLGFTIGSKKQSLDEQAQQTTAAASTIGSIGGNIHIQAGKTFTQIGSDLITPQGDTRIQAQNIAIIEARESSVSQSEQKFSQSGLTLALSSPVISALQGVQQTAQAIKDTGSGRMQALGAAAAVLQAQDAIPGAAGAAQNIAQGGTGGIGLSISMGSSQSSSKSQSQSDTARGSRIKAGGNIALEATGAGKDSKLLIQGSDIQAGKTTTLSADNAVTLQAAQNSSEQHSTNSGRSGSIGVSIGTSGIGITASASKSKGSGDGQDQTWTNTQVSGNQVNIQSGGDTTLKGATVTGKEVSADVGNTYGGNLNIESLQDQSSDQSQQSSMGGSLAVGMGMISGSLSASKSKVNSHYQSVTEQSGIKAGDDGFAVTVRGNTALIGGAITSTQAAIDHNKNSFQSAGLSMRDIQNSAQYQGSGYGITAGISTGQDANGKQKTTPSSSTGVGQTEGRASSTTRAAISGIAGNKDARTGDAETGIQKIFDADKVNKTINAQVQITAQFGSRAAKEVGHLADSKAKDLRQQAAQAEASGNTDQAKALRDEATRWDEGGAYRSLAHAAIGGVTGGTDGALGAGSAALSADAINKVTDNLPEGVKQIVGAGIAAGIGATAEGGLQGIASATNADVNNRQLHPTELQRIKDLAKDDSQKEARLTAAACALVHCADGVPQDDPTYPYLRAMQDAGVNYSDEKQLLNQQRGLDGRSYQTLYQYDSVDAGLDWASQNKMGSRAIGVGQTVAGIAGIAGSAALCTSGAGCVVGAATGTVSADYALAGAKQAVTGNSATPYGEQVLQSLGLSPQAAAYTYAALGIAPAALDAVLASKAARQTAKYNTLAKASYSDFTPGGIKATPEIMATPQAQTLMSELKAGSPGLADNDLKKFVIDWIETGNSLPTPAVANATTTLIKIVPKGDGVSPTTPYFVSPDQARTLSTMSPEQIGQALGLPATQAANMLKNGVDYFAMTPKSGASPTVFVSDVARTTQGTVKTAPNTTQVIVPNRSLWSDPKPVNPATFR
jgi:filamentous hemagglutinin